jgi:hypothetical protein
MEPASTIISPAGLAVASVPFNPSLSRDREGAVLYSDS